jgi:hypothetical protein
MSAARRAMFSHWSMERRRWARGSMMGQSRRRRWRGGWPLRRADHHVGLAAQHPVDDLGLELGDELGQEDDHRHPAGGAGEDQQGLHAPLAQEAQGHEGEGQAELHRRPTAL